MPAKKTHRQSVKRHSRNGSARTATRSAINKALRSVNDGDVPVAQTAVLQAISAIDQAVRKGVMPKNSAARRKSRISIRLNELQKA